MDNKFWLEAEENGDTCIGHQDRISVYVNGNGDIVIRQEDTMNDEDSLVIVNSQNIRALIVAIEGAAEQA